MNAYNDFALLVAIAIPVLVVVALNVYLFLAGEHDTLLLPGVRSWPSVEAPVSDAAPVTTGYVPATAAANETFEREAA